MSEPLPPDPADQRPPDTPERRALMARMAVHVARIRRRMDGHKIMHATCGWTGDELTEDDRCPRCGEKWGD